MSTSETTSEDELLTDQDTDVSIDLENDLIWEQSPVQDSSTNPINPVLSSRRTTPAKEFLQNIPTPPETKISHHQEDQNSQRIPNYKNLPRHQEDPSKIPPPFPRSRPPQNLPITQPPVHIPRIPQPRLPSQVSLNSVVDISSVIPFAISTSEGSPLPELTDEPSQARPRRSSQPLNYQVFHSTGRKTGREDR